MVAYNKEFVKSDGRKLVASGPRSSQNRTAPANQEISELRAELIKLQAQVIEASQLKSIMPASNNTVVNGFTQEQVDAMVNKTAEEVSLDMDKHFNSIIFELKTNIASKDSTIALLEERLDEVKSNTKIKEQEYISEIKELKKILSEKENFFNSRLDIKDATIKELADKLAEIPNRPVYVNSSSDNQVQVEEDIKRPSMDNVFIDPSKKGAENSMKSHVKIKEIKNISSSNASDSVNKLKGLMGKLPKK